jgi:hypothetical protein
MSNKKQDELDTILDAALAKYAAADPRTGLEDRVLAHLRAERTRTPAPAWRRWSVAAALAVVVVAVALALRPGKVTTHPAVGTQAPNQPATQAASNRGGSDSLPPEPTAVRKRTTPRTHPPILIAAQPKLDQFPSPQPLSDQERILAIYVAQYPEQAVLIARARSEELRRDQIEEMKTFRSGATAADSEEPNSNSTER